MKATKRNKIKLLIAALALATLLAAVLVGCNNHKTDSYAHLVTFNYNLGNEITGNAPNQYLGVKEDNSLVSIRPGYNDSSFAEASVSGYYLEDWYEAELDAEGNVQLEEDGRVKLKATPWDFANGRVTKDITLYAKFVKSPRLLFIDIDTGEQVGEIDGKRPGERRNTPSIGFEPTKTVNGVPYTFKKHYYVDKEKTAEFVFPYTFGTEDQEVYVDFIEGTWTLVSTSGELSSALTNGQNVYLLGDIDCSSIYWNVASYNGEFNGNGYTVSGIKATYANINNRNRLETGIFATLMGRAYVHDVTFSDVQFAAYVTQEDTFDEYMGFFATTVNAGARVENVTVSGTFTLDALAWDCVESEGVTVSAFIARNNTTTDRIVNCDYSGVILI